MSVLIRKALADLRIADETDTSDAITRIMSYFNRTKGDDHQQVRTKITTRYDTYIKTEKDPAVSEDAIQTYARGRLTKQVNSGQISNLSIGFHAKIVTGNATLFTEPGQKFSLTHDSVEDVSAAEELLTDNRKAGNYDTMMVGADQLSVQIGSAALLVEFQRGNLSYQKFNPGEVKFFYNDYINEEGELRPTDRTDPEDATCILFRLGTVDDITYSYLAIFGASDEYENGRYVFFQGNKKLTRVPEVGTKGIIDHEIDGEIANPLSWYANQPENADKDLPEYPMVIFDGGITEDKVPMPWTTSLYECSLEFDIDSSHNVEASQKAVSGTRALTRDNPSTGKPIPPTLSGDIALLPGQDVKVVPHDSAAIETGQKVIEDNMLHTASGYAVPDFLVISRDHTVEASSGVALAVKSIPMIKKREDRIRKNTPQVTKLFVIEKSYIAIHNDPSPEIALLVDCDQTWDPGEFKLPEDQNKKAERITKYMEKGVYDIIDAIREAYDCTSDQEAIEIYERKKERKEKYPPLIADKKKPIGLPGRVKEPTFGE